MIPTAYQCEIADCPEAQADGTAFCATHLPEMRMRRIAEMEKEAADKDAAFIAKLREAQALDMEVVA